MCPSKAPRGGHYTRTEIERHVWWKVPPKAGQTDEDLVWGYLVFYDDGAFEWLDERPPWAEVINRSTCFDERYASEPRV